MAHYFEQQAARWIARWAPSPSFVHDVGRRIVAALPGGDVTIERISQELAMSSRTLRRRLQEEKTTFEKLRNETRNELARRYLGCGSVSLAEIALLLGFSDQTAFQRAFRRWTGETPRAYRNQHRSDPLRKT